MRLRALSASAVSIISLALMFIVGPSPVLAIVLPSLFIAGVVVLVTIDPSAD